MTGVCKHNNWKAGESRNDALPVDEVDVASLFQSISLGEMVDYKDNQVTY